MARTQYKENRLCCGKNLDILKDDGTKEEGEEDQRNPGGGRGFMWESRVGQWKKNRSRAPGVGSHGLCAFLARRL